MSMAHDHHDAPFPKGALIGAGAVVGITLLMTGAVSLGVIAKPQNDQQVRISQGLKPVTIRKFTFADQPGGALVIGDAVTGQVATTILPGENSGFIRGVLRGMMRERKMSGIGIEAPFTLTLWEDQRLSLEDPSTKRVIELGSFGPDNRKAFMKLISAGALAK
jgi:putative photosynthetic complex assembly protein